MKTRSRNIMVGLTVLVGLALLGAMILIFAGAPRWLRGGYTINIVAPHSGGIRAGQDVNMSGMRVGTVTEVRFRGDDPRQGVLMVAHIDEGVLIPVGTQAVTSTGLMGGASMGLEVAQQQDGFLATDGSATIEGRVSGSIIDELRPAAQSLNSLAKNISSVLGGPEQQPATDTATGPAVPAVNIQTTIARLDETLTALNSVLADPDNQRNIKITLDELREFTSNGAEAMDAVRKLARDLQGTAAEASQAIKTVNTTVEGAGRSFDRLTQALMHDAEALSVTLNGMNKAIEATTSGQGTTGRLITDPHLYNNLVNVTDQMSSLLQETRQALQLWKDKGVPIKLR